MSIEDYEHELREGQKSILQALYPDDYKKLKEAAKKLGIDFERARQARQYGKGSTITINGLIFIGIGIHPKEIKKYLPKVRTAVKQSSELSVLDELVEDARRCFGENELIAWLRLLMARYEIEAELGIRKKSSGRPKK